MTTLERFHSTSSWEVVSPEREGGAGSFPLETATEMVGMSPGEEECQLTVSSGLTNTQPSTIRRVCQESHKTPDLQAMEPKQHLASTEPLLSRWNWEPPSDLCLALEQSVLRRSAGEANTNAKIFELLKYQGEEQLLKEMQEWTVPSFPISGHHLQKMGMSFGKEIGTALQQLRDEWKKCGCHMDKEELLSCLKKLESE
ncbi:hypothetical protein HGM15179_003801 [Zosterops borbonicus]|uniref:Uncharacterized protein n=1 Tax=Zosterops borbonicus TaxID=364589 RepID=A0A8K1LQT4_9PASS|nr:hypothetical protein HGM15179_003801 [Zosterops borbonicus]